ncbi:MAG: hypothetical protein IKZ95_03490, partial [Lachnospiraceae bacterium]|nr:hypothetical protein [Lachnospiraceae bacterium]
PKQKLMTSLQNLQKKAQKEQQNNFDLLECQSRGGNPPLFFCDRGDKRTVPLSRFSRIYAQLML